MAKVIAPFKIIGTIDDLNFYMTTEGNLVRTKGKTGITTKQFLNDPIFEKVRRHSKEFGNCVVYSKTFRMLVKPFFDKAKEVSFAGRVNKLLFDIVKNDTKNELGSRTLVNGINAENGVEELIGFEANKLRPIEKILKRKITLDWETLQLNSKTLNPLKDFVWPEATCNQIHLQLAISNWDIPNNQFETNYSNEIILNNEKESIHFTIDKPKSQNLWIVFLYIGFTNKEKNKTTWIHRKHNTATLIAAKYFRR